MPEKSALKFSDIFPDFIIHGHKLHGLSFHGHDYSRFKASGVQVMSVLIITDNVTD